jgi:hypothetical protein
MRHKMHNAAEAAQIQEMRKTMTLNAIAASKGVNRSVIDKILTEHGEARGGDQTYRPRVLQKWPEHTGFSNDDLQVRVG